MSIIFISPRMIYIYALDLGVQAFLYVKAYLKVNLSLFLFPPTCIFPACPFSATDTSILINFDTVISFVSTSLKLTKFGLISTNILRLHSLFSLLTSSFFSHLSDYNYHLVILPTIVSLSILSNLFCSSQADYSTYCAIMTISTIHSKISVTRL